MENLWMIIFRLTTHDLDLGTKTGYTDVNVTRHSWFWLKKDSYMDITNFVHEMLHYFNFIRRVWYSVVLKTVGLWV